MPCRSCTSTRPLGRLPAEVESTGYFVVAEGLTNAVKHAAAQRISIDLAVRDGRLEITVTDDGTGPADPHRGVRAAQPAGPGRGARRYGDAPTGTLPGIDPAGGVRMRVIIAEDEALLREGIARILSDEGYDIVALAGDRDDLTGKVRAPAGPGGHRHPDAARVHRRGPRRRPQIRRAHPDIAIIVLSQHVDTAGPSSCWPAAPTASATCSNGG